MSARSVAADFSKCIEGLQDLFQVWSSEVRIELHRHLGKFQKFVGLQVFPEVLEGHGLEIFFACLVTKEARASLRG